MEEPQITHSFKTKEEESKFYLECGKQSRTKEVLELIDKKIEGLRPKKGYEVLGIIHGLESIETLEELKARIQALDSPPPQPKSCNPEPPPQAGGCEGEYRRFTVHYMPRTSVDKLPWGILDSETSTTEHVSTREAALKAANEMEEWYKKYTKTTEISDE